MLIMHQNCIAYDNLDNEDVLRVQDVVISHDDGDCWFEVADGDESVQRSLGESYSWDQILSGDYSSGADVIVVPSALRDNIAPDLAALGFRIQESYYSGEDRYFCEGNEAHYIRRGRPIGYSPINGQGGTMVKKAKAWSMPEECWTWLESQPNQSEVLRQMFADIVQD